MEEKDGIIANNTYVEISLKEYRRLRRLPKGVPKAIPSMCVMTIKRDEHLAPDRAKSRIVVLGNLENRVWQKSEKYAPVLQYSSLRLLTSMAVKNRRRLKQGDCKNVFCNTRLPPDETTIIKPPAGDPDAKNDVFWLLQKTEDSLRSRSLAASLVQDGQQDPHGHGPQAEPPWSMSLPRCLILSRVSRSGN